jgi:hypothetical protein
MWLCDLEKALGKVVAFLGADACAVCVESIKPCADGGIAFALSDGGYVKWFPDGEIVRRGRDDWRMSPRPTPRVPSNGSVGGQMVRRMIEAYEGRMNNG